MEIVIEHKLEAEIAGAPPRRPRLALRLTLLLTVAYLLLALFVAGCGRALWEAGKLGWIAGAGQTAKGHVIEIRIEATTQKAAWPSQIAVRYAVEIPGRAGRQTHRTGWIGLGRGETRRYHLGQPLAYRYAPWFGGVAGFPWQPAPMGRLVSLLLSGGLVLPVSAFLLRRLTRWLHDHLSLLREGLATVGTIIDKRTEADDMLRYFLRYGYATLPGIGWEREEQVSQEQWREFEIGQPVTVLYDPALPEHAGLYALMHR